MRKCLSFFWHNFFSYVLFFPLSFFFFILSFIIKIRFGSIRSQRIGHFIINTEFYLIEKKRDKIKYLDILYTDKIICNFHIYKMIKRKIYLFPSFFLHVHKFFKLFSNKNFEINILNYGARDTNNFLRKYKQQIDFSEEECSNAKKIFIENFGFDPDEKKIVYLTVRDSEYLKRQFPKNDWSYHNYRDWNVNYFLPASEYLANLGYKVFRMGKITNQALKIDHPNIFDYANSKSRSDILDIFIAKKSYFAVSTGLGIDNAPLLFRKPIAMIHLPFEFSYFHNHNLNMTQHHYCTIEKKNLSISEIFKKGSEINFKYNTDSYKKLKINLVPNSTDEIIDFIKEMHLKLNNTKIVDANDLKLEKKFWDVFNYNLKKYNLEKEHGIMTGQFSLSFLKRNPYFLN